jgi:hypothetical protein
LEAAKVGDTAKVQVLVKSEDVDINIKDQVKQ